MTMTGRAGSHAAGRTMTIGDLFGDGRVSPQIQVDGAATHFGQAPSSVRERGGRRLRRRGARRGGCEGKLVRAHASAGRGVRRGLVRAQSTSGATLATMPIATSAPPPTAATDAGPTAQP